MRMTGRWVAARLGRSLARLGLAVLLLAAASLGAAADGGHHGGHHGGHSHVFVGFGFGSYWGYGPYWGPWWGPYPYYYPYYPYPYYYPPAAYYPPPAYYPAPAAMVVTPAQANCQSGEWRREDGSVVSGVACQRPEGGLACAARLALPA